MYKTPVIRYAPRQALASSGDTYASRDLPVLISRFYPLISHSHSRSRSPPGFTHPLVIYNSALALNKAIGLALKKGNLLPTFGLARNTFRGVFRNTRRRARNRNEDCRWRIYTLLSALLIHIKRVLSMMSSLIVILINLCNVYW